jgi:hypothetical protein
MDTYRPARLPAAVLVAGDVAETGGAAEGLMAFGCSLGKEEARKEQGKEAFGLRLLTVVVLLLNGKSSLFLSQILREFVFSP